MAMKYIGMMSVNRLWRNQRVSVRLEIMQQLQPHGLGHFNIFVGDLSPEVTDAILFSCFSVYSTCSDVRVMWDQKTGRSRGFGFVSFRNQQDAQSEINDLNGKWLGSRQILCNWAAKGAASDDKPRSDTQSVVELTNGTSAVEESKPLGICTGITKSFFCKFTLLAAHFTFNVFQRNFLYFVLMS